MSVTCNGSPKRVYLSRERSRVRETLSIQQVAAAELILPEVRWGDMDPTRRQLLTRAQNAGVSIKPIVEVDSPAAALALAERGVGDTVITLPLAHALGWTKSLYWNLSSRHCTRHSLSSRDAMPISRLRLRC